MYVCTRHDLLVMRALGTHTTGTWPTILGLELGPSMVFHGIQNFDAWFVEIHVYLIGPNNAEMDFYNTYWYLLSVSPLLFIFAMRQHCFVRWLAAVCMFDWQLAPPSNRLPYVNHTVLCAARCYPKKLYYRSGKCNKFVQLYYSTVDDTLFDES